jgi:hypothetical protein
MDTKQKRTAILLTTRKSYFNLDGRQLLQRVLLGGCTRWVRDDLEASFFLEY